MQKRFWLGLASWLLSACGSLADEGIATEAGQRSGLRTQPASLTDTACQLSGTWAFKFVVPVQWVGNQGVRSGQGDIVQYLRVVRQLEAPISNPTAATGLDFVDSLQICGSLIPDYRSTKPAGNELFGMRFADSFFDHNEATHGLIRTHLQAATPGAAYSTDFGALELGVALHDPVEENWPIDLKTLYGVIDADHDGYPGVTLETDKRAGYKNPPTTFTRLRRATHVFTAIRNVARSDGYLTSCNTLSGALEIPYLSGVFSVNAHVLGCLKDNGSQCTLKETAMIDKFQPLYAPYAPATVLQQRLEDDANCATVRAAFDAAP